MNYDFDRIIDRRKSESMKWKKYDEDVISMWMADMDFAAPQPVIDALAERVQHGIFGYASPPEELSHLIVENMAAKHNWKIAEDDLLFIPGITDGFNIASQAIGEPGDHVLMQTPVYYPFLQAPGKADQIPLPMELTRREDGHYSVDYDLFESTITARTRLFLFCNPHNPIGRVFAREELERMAEICLRNEIVICSDEVHCDLVYTGHEHVPIASIDPEIAARTITLVAPSKTYNLAGLKLGVAVIQNEELRKRYANWLSKLDAILISIFGYVGAVAAYSHGEEWLKQLMLYLEGNRDLLHQFVSERLPGISMASPQGTYLAWLDCRQAEIPTNPQEFFLKEARVGLNDGQPFGKGGEGFVRLNFACPRPVLTEALTRMESALGHLKTLS